MALIIIYYKLTKATFLYAILQNAKFRNATHSLFIHPFINIIIFNISAILFIEKLNIRKKDLILYVERR